MPVTGLLVATGSSDSNRFCSHHHFVSIVCRISDSHHSLSGLGFVLGLLPRGGVWVSPPGSERAPGGSWDGDGDPDASSRHPKTAGAALMPHGLCLPWSSPRAHNVGARSPCLMEEETEARGHSQEASSWGWPQGCIGAGCQSPRVPLGSSDKETREMNQVSCWLLCLVPRTARRGTLPSLPPAVGPVSEKAGAWGWASDTWLCPAEPDFLTLSVLPPKEEMRPMFWTWGFLSTLQGEAWK